MPASEFLSDIRLREKVVTALRKAVSKENEVLREKVKNAYTVIDQQTQQIEDIKKGKSGLHTT